MIYENTVILSEAKNLKKNKEDEGMKQVYPVFIVEDGKFFLVYVPDMDLFTQGMDMGDAICMARDIIGLHGIGMEDNKEELPAPSSFEGAMEKAKANTRVTDFTKGILTYVDIDFVAYRREIDNTSVRRNVSLPNWLNTAAEKAGVNVSGVLQEALKKVLNKEKAN